MVYRRTEFLRAGGYVEESGHYSDWFSTTVVAYRHGVCVVPKPLAIFNIESITYYQRSRRNRSSNEAAIEHALNRLRMPEYTAVAGPPRESGGLYIFGFDSLRVMLRHSEYGGFLTPRFVRKTLWHATRFALKQSAPTFLVNWYAGVAGYRRGPARSSLTTR